MRTSLSLKMVLTIALTMAGSLSLSTNSFALEEFEIQLGKLKVNYPEQRIETNDGFETKKAYSDVISPKIEVDCNSRTCTFSIDTGKFFSLSEKVKVSIRDLDARGYEALREELKKNNLKGEKKIQIDAILDQLDKDKDTEGTTSNIFLKGVTNFGYGSAALARAKTAEAHLAQEKFIRWNKIRDFTYVYNDCIHFSSKGRSNLKIRDFETDAKKMKDIVVQLGAGPVPENCRDELKVIEKEIDEIANSNTVNIDKVNPQKMIDEGLKELAIASAKVDPDKIFCCHHGGPNSVKGMNCPDTLPMIKAIKLGRTVSVGPKDCPKVEQVNKGSERLISSVCKNTPGFCFGGPKCIYVDEDVKIDGKPLKIPFDAEIACEAKIARELPASSRPSDVPLHEAVCPSETACLKEAGYIQGGEPLLDALRKINNGRGSVQTDGLSESDRAQ